MFVMSALPSDFNVFWQHHVAEHACGGVQALADVAEVADEGKAEVPSRSAPPRAELTKVANLKESAIVLMKAFLFDASEYKEKNFTPVVSKVLKLNQLSS